MNMERMRGIFGNLLNELEEAKLIDTKANLDIMNAINKGVDDTILRREGKDKENIKPKDNLQDAKKQAMTD